MSHVTPEPSGDTKEGLRATLRDLVALHGVSGFEQPVVARYLYSPNEMVDLNDAAGAVRLLVRFIADMDRHDDLGFG